MRSRSSLAALTAALLFVVLPVDLSAQDGFLFGPPRTELTLRGGAMFHSGGGDLFDFFRSELTLDREDLLAYSGAAEASFYLLPRLDLAAGIGVSNLERRSEFRDWVDEDDLPIAQTTTLRVVPLTASLRFYPLARGDRISSLAWVPARTTPYIGAGGGVAWYNLRQVGDFVSETDDQSAIIFSDDYSDRGTAGSVHALAGVQHWISSRVGINFEGRYTLSSTTPAEDFTNWEELDIGGLQLGLGVSFRW